MVSTRACHGHFVAGKHRGRSVQCFRASVVSSDGARIVQRRGKSILRELTFGSNLQFLALDFCESNFDQPGCGHTDRKHKRKRSPGLRRDPLYLFAWHLELSS